ncbi:hypothetical protein ACFVZM_06845 [Streptomyces sioyaensis]|uniref:hypothetical protein n=1 Tax=Streptomyces sioyaensis TaxID=67364 RepID=UPI0036A1F159
MATADGAHVEIVEPDHEPGSGVLPLTVRVNGTDVGTLAAYPKIRAGDGRTQCTVTLVLVPSLLEVKGDEADRSSGSKIGFS